MNDNRRYVAELLGTFTLVFGGSLAILSAGTLQEPILVAVAFGFGLSLLAGLYAFAEISGGHYNPAVSLSMFLSGRLESRDLVAYLLRRQGRISQPNIGRHNDHLRSRWSECRGQAQRPNRRIGLLRRHPRLLAVPLTLLTRTLLIETNPRLGWALPLIAGKAEPTEKPEQPQKEAAGTTSK